MPAGLRRVLLFLFVADPILLLLTAVGVGLYYLSTLIGWDPLCRVAYEFTRAAALLAIVFLIPFLIAAVTLLINEILRGVRGGP